MLDPNFSIGFILDSLSKKVKREWITDKDFLLKALDDPLFEGAIIGSYSIYNVRNRTCYVYQDRDSFKVPVSPTSVARKIIEGWLSFDNRKCYPKAMRDKEIPLLSAPLFAQPYQGELIYLDLKKAFFQIYSKMPIYMGRIRGNWTISPPWIFPMLPCDLMTHKLTRNAIVGNWRATTITRIKSGRIVRQDSHVPTANFVAWNFVQSVLNYFADIALQCGAVYVHTDGYIFPNHSGYLDFEGHLSDLGFFLSVKGRGVGQIFGIGRYEVGSCVTKCKELLPTIKKVDSCGDVVLTLKQLQKHNPFWRESRKYVQ